MSDSSVPTAFVGLLDPEGPEREANPAYSAAGTLFQERLLDSLLAGGIDVRHVFALRPAVSFPHGPRLFFGSARSLLVGRIDTSLLPFVNLGPLKPVSAGMSLLPRLLRWAWDHRRNRRRVFLVFNVANPPGIASVLAARLTGTKVIAVVADIQVPGSGFLPATFLRRLEYRLQTRTLSLFDGLVVLTRRMADDFAPRTPYIQLEGAVPEELLARGPTPSVDRDEVRPCDDVLMYAGGLHELKGIPLLLAAFARLPGDRYRLWITGAGPLRGMVEEAAARDPRITFWGFPPYEDVLRLYQRATMLINPHSSRLLSARYVFPSKLVEYLATGRPVISTCSTPEVAEEYGDVLYRLEREDPDELAALIQHVAALPEGDRAALGARARQYVLERKTWSAQGRRVAAFIRQVAGCTYQEGAAP